LSFDQFDASVKASKTSPPVEDDEDDEGGPEGQAPVVKGIVSGGYELVVEDGKIVDLVHKQ
jgi:hypothetical protein